MHIKLYLTEEMQNNDSPNLSDFNQISDVTDWKTSVFLECHTLNVVELHCGVICDFAEIQLAFPLINEKVLEIQNHNILELFLKTVSLQY